MSSFRFQHRIMTLAPSRPPRRLPWRSGVILVTLLAALLVASPTLSALRLGTTNAETLTGTKGNDHLTGAEGNDLLKGLAGNDTYFFADGWGSDELVEKPGEGTDTLNFRGVRTSGIAVHLIRDWDPLFQGMDAEGPGGFIDLSTGAGQAAIEKVIGGQGAEDVIVTGSGQHTLQPGGGAVDYLFDEGGYNDGPDGNPEVPVSNDVYKGFGDNTGTDLVLDYGGSRDVVDLRPFSIDDVYISRFDADGLNGTRESLQIVTGPTSEVIVAGHFGEYRDKTSQSNMQGRIEKLIFADATLTSTNGLAAATASSATATSGKQAELADAADRLAKEARGLLAEMPEPGTLQAAAGDGRKATATGPDGEPDRHTSKATTKTRDTKQAKQATHEKKEKKAKKSQTQRTRPRQHPAHRAGGRSG